ncbi:MAG: hypothetical protein F6K36_25155 [Symploca sp. SIO3C6]|uniref:Uncharacterized protein n=1 Tax=Symploca sp. SIO1C4 TaxID=2607765 RepID=A0A6B3NLL5_9CYAN|nr:hypothetical protein [Symploca sp. SIO3C6]NER31084.1 hypothetical protein [Symploca sp. SIO1C4]NET03260.1 hypothetical protein [Symploca sp. SIO2B6]NET53500.1 hypothetical protein [Merismopedia sp. SIO2A8]
MQLLTTQTNQASCLQTTAFKGLQAGAWIHLEEVPSTFAHHEGLLLCQVSQWEWVMWIPEHGEHLLKIKI